ncbi:hypothetical protein SDC9_155074 [bioreactor metagenome]|uniref:Uncharacterized protein n=1 Tax=bioreactor metagenome TaxID=1076179 RepID=A0A645F2Q5_9ZZZZ
MLFRLALIAFEIEFGGQSARRRGERDRDEHLFQPVRFPVRQVEQPDDERSGRMRLLEFPGVEHGAAVFKRNFQQPDAVFRFAADHRRGAGGAEVNRFLRFHRLDFDGGGPLRREYLRPDGCRGQQEQRKKRDLNLVHGWWILL